MLTQEQQERVRLLVATLRSGKYRQGKFGLNLYHKKAKKRKLCCLGVACEVARLSGLELRIERDPDKYADGQLKYDGESGLLPMSVQNWFGFNNADPELRANDGECVSASHLNDFQGYKFGRIADAFERTFLNNY